MTEDCIALYIVCLHVYSELDFEQTILDLCLSSSLVQRRKANDGLMNIKISQE